MALESLPKDAIMLLSFVNTRLRDDGIDLDSLCSQFDVSKDEIVKKLDSVGYTYNVELNKFI
ncbi:MAG: DUF4250 domain-containing protein [Lachnospiraceae bacterium]|nr:DUF4250 domain-containing protein [Lachnospiraceae bacterium]MBQ9277011.1 DUF4250 domain-containing protein [Lachnospiraceae bacterium]